MFEKQETVYHHQLLEYLLSNSETAAHYFNVLYPLGVYSSLIELSEVFPDAYLESVEFSKFLKLKLQLQELQLEQEITKLRVSENSTYEI